MGHSPGQPAHRFHLLGLSELGLALDLGLLDPSQDVELAEQEEPAHHEGGHEGEAAPEPLQPRVGRAHGLAQEVDRGKEGEREEGEHRSPRVSRHSGAAGVRGDRSGVLSGCQPRALKAMMTKGTVHATSMSPGSISVFRQDEVDRCPHSVEHGHGDTQLREDAPPRGPRGADQPEEDAEHEEAARGEEPGLPELVLLRVAGDELPQDEVGVRVQEEGEEQAGVEGEADPGRGRAIGPHERREEEGRAAAEEQEVG